MKMLFNAALLLTAIASSAACAAPTEPESTDEQGAEREAAPAPAVETDTISPQKNNWDLCKRMMNRCFSRCAPDAFTRCSASCVDDYFDCGRN